jgi:cyclophilin family peptidyl-prolyl cis-trans isomerase
MKKLYLLICSLFVFAVSPGQGIDKPQYQIVTHRAGVYLGTFNIELFPLVAPLHVANFDSLVNDQFYDSTAFHRVVPGFVIQGGDPNSINGPVSTWGQGQSWQVTVPAEFSAIRHLRGILGAARDSDPNSANSQFYICVANATSLDGNYTVYGKVISGMDVVDTIVNSPRNANDVPLQKIEMFVTYTGVNDSIPDAPVLSLPADGSTGILNTQNFSWSTVNSAVLYTVEFSTDSNFSTIDVSKTAGLNSTLATTLNGSTQYYWRVKSNNGGHESIYSNVFSFNTATAAANLIYPQDLAVNIPINTVFSWGNVPNATSYTLQVSTTSTFTTQSMIYNVAGITDTTQLVNGMNSNTVYYWRVRTANGATQGFFSPKFSFTTGTSTGIEAVTADNEFTLENVYPNPARDFIELRGSSAKQGVMQIRITDQLGRLFNEQQVIINSQHYELNLKLPALAAGIYIVSLKMQEKELVTTVEIN